MQDSPADKPARVLLPRNCADCSVSFIPATTTSWHCPPCQADRTRRLKADAQRHRAAGTNARSCEDCGVRLLPARGRPARRCETCREVYWKANDRQRNKARTESGERKKYDERYREDSRETIQANNRKYKAAHPETDQAAIHRRRQRCDAGMTDLDRELSRAYRVAIRNDPCFYCGNPAAGEVDHFFPLSKGGTDHFFNLVRSCQRCNRGQRGKRDRCGTAFMLRIGMRDRDRTVTAIAVVPPPRQSTQAALF